MTEEERKLALYCLKANSDYHSEVCEECVNYPNCDHTIQDDVTETIIKALEQEPCDDVISRQALLDDFGLSEKTRKWGGDHGGYNTMMLYEIQDMIESAPSVKPQEPKWIPVSERLPENRNQEVLISLEWGIDIGRYSDGEWHSEWINHYDDGNVLAWMPLPEPYKAESEEV